MTTKIAPNEVLRMSQNEAANRRDDIVMRAHNACREAKKQAEAVCKEAKKMAVDKGAKELAEKAFKEAVKRAEEVRETIIREAMAVFNAAWERADREYKESTK